MVRLIKSVRVGKSCVVHPQLFGPVVHAIDEPFDGPADMLGNCQSGIVRGTQQHCVE